MERRWRADHAKSNPLAQPIRLRYERMMDIALSLVVLTAIALVWGSITLFKRPGYRKQAVLMLVLAAIMAINVAILALPTSGGDSPLSKAGNERAAE